MARKLSETEQKASSAVLDDLRKTAQDMMKNKLTGAKKVTVASNTKEGLKKGLSKAEEILGVDDHSEDEDSVPGKLDAHQMLKEHLQHGEESEDESAAEDLLEGPEGELEEAESEDLSPEAIDARIKELMALKAKKQAKY